jgi:hypothetical protein
MSPFRIFGSLALAFGVLGIIVVFANLGRGPLGGHSLVPFTSAALFSVLIGLGLLFHRKWAAVLFAVTLASIGMWMVILSIVKVPLPWLILNIAFGGVLLVPGVITVRCWPQLNRNGQR